MSRARFLLKFTPLIGIFLFIFIIINIDLVKVVETFSRFNLIYFLAAFGISLLFSLPKTLKWIKLIKSCEINYSLREGVNVFFISGFISMITPGRIGEFVKGIYLKDSTNTSLGKSISTVLMDRIIDIGVLILFAITGILAFSYIYNFGTNIMIIIIILFIIFVSFAFIAMNKKYTKTIIKPIFSRVIPEKYKEKIRVNFDEFYSGIEMITNRKKTLIMVILLSVLIWMGGFFQFYMIALGFNIKISYFLIVMICSITMIFEMIPISVAGIGAREAVFIIFFSLIGLTAIEAISFSLMLLFYQYVCVLPGLFLWAKKPIKI